MRTWPAFVALCWLTGFASASAQTGAGGGVIDVQATRPRAGNTFDALWETYRRADQAGETEVAEKTFKEIRRLRTERNVRSLDDLALALLARGREHLRKGEVARAEADFTNAVGLDPQLPDAYLARAQLEFGKGPVGMLQAAQDTVRGLGARLPTARGRYFAWLLIVPVGLLTLGLTTCVFAVALLIRNGSLLRHDLEERLGRGLALGLWVTMLVLPCAALQGVGWLPLWWIALLFVYLTRSEKLVAATLLFLGLLVGPAVSLLEARVLAERNALFQATIQTIERGPESRSRTALEGAVARYPDDRDLQYLLGVQYKKDGRYDDASALYRELLRADAQDRVALNNLANVEFARGEFAPAIARYKQGAEQTQNAAYAATFLYNLSLAHLQRFEYQPAQDARNQAERLGGGLVREYDGSWKYDNGNYAVVDLSLTADEAATKFLGSLEGPGRRNVAGRASGAFGSTLLSAALNRFAGFLAAALVAVAILKLWRGRGMFTLRCNKCGTPFCKLCHLGGAAGGLCTQCYHLFVVRDGVSSPARNQKLLEVQKEDEGRERAFRLLSLLSPGAGHFYAQKPLLGLVLAGVWYATLALMLLAGRVLPFTEASSTFTGPWGLLLAGIVLLVTYVVANRARPDFEFMLPAPRAGRRRG